MKQRTEQQIVSILKATVERAPSLRAWAIANKLSAAYLSGVLRGRIKPGRKIAAALGYKREVIYVEIEK